MKCKIKKQWIEMEREHNSSNEKAKKIVEDHIKEHGCDYYPELKKLTKNLEGGYHNGKKEKN